MTSERQAELRSRIDRKFDQFSLEEFRQANSGAMTFAAAFPGIAVSDREFAEQYFNQKVSDLRQSVKETVIAKHVLKNPLKIQVTDGFTFAAGVEIEMTDREVYFGTIKCRLIIVNGDEFPACQADIDEAIR